MSGWEARARLLAEKLAAQGVLADPAWRSAFEQTPRHIFIPRYHRNGQIFSRDDPEQRDRWLAGVYDDESLVTQEAPVPDTDLRIPTSSSTKPSLMARMLHLLDLHDGDRVMEVGTGTGYNAALLCHRLGSAQVASVDIDSNLVYAAGERLSRLGYRPLLVAGPGAEGIPERAPYSRIIATCAVPTIPTRWISQLSLNGYLLADVRGEISSSLIRLAKIDDENVQGRFLAEPGHFMWLRARADNPLRDGDSYNTMVNIDDSRQGTTDLDPATLENPDLRSVVQWRMPEIRNLYRNDRGWLHIGADGGFTEVNTNPNGGRYDVRELGHGPSWQVIEEAVRWWLERGRPARSRFGLTASTSGMHAYWLDTPGDVFHAVPVS